MIAYKAYREDGKIAKVTLENSKGEGIESSSFPELLDFLLANSLEENEFHVAWNLDAFTACVLSVLPKDKVADVLSYSELKRPTTVTTEAQDKERKSLREKIRGWLLPYDIEFVSEHRLKIQKGGWKVVLYHLSQFFYDDTPEPEVKEAAKMGQAILDELKSIKHPITPFSLSSAGSIITPMMRNLNLPTWKDLPPRVSELYRQTTRRPWISAIKLGHIKECYDWDLSAAYLSELAELHDHRLGDWIESKVPPKGAKYGVASGRVTITSDVSPIIYVKNTERFNPSGTWKDCLNKTDIDTIEQHNLGRFNIEQGFWWVPNRISKPLHYLAHYCYNLRNRPVLSLTAKRLGNSIWGLTLQEYNVFGEFANPCWGSNVETNIRCKVFDFIASNNLIPDLVAVNVDGFISQKPIALPKHQYEKPGDWRLDSSGEALSISSGLVFYGKKKPNGVTLQQALDTVKAKPKASHWTIPSTRPSTPSDLLNGKYTQEKSINLGFGLSLPSNMDRIYKPAPANGFDLLNSTFTSKPIEIQACL